MGCSIEDVYFVLRYEGSRQIIFVYHDSPQNFECLSPLRNSHNHKTYSCIKFCVRVHTHAAINIRIYMFVY